MTCDHPNPVPRRTHNTWDDSDHAIMWCPDCGATIGNTPPPPPTPETR